MNAIRAYGAWCVFLTVLGLAFPALGTTIVMPTDEQLIEKSPVIVNGVVVRTEAKIVGGGVVTETVISVNEVLKGEVSGELTIREIGGRVGDRETVVFGAPEYRQGEEVLVFLWPTERGDYQTMDLFVGKFSEKYTIDGERLWYRDPELPNTNLLDREFRPLERRMVQREAAGFAAYIRDRVAGREGNRNYGVAEPALVENFQSNFQLIADPQVYRWFAFENGSTVVWRSSGTQPGYANGGVDDTKIALNAWSGYGGALIRYAWGGASAVSPGGLDNPNGVNEVVFNDPLNEIAGSWSGSGGGVVGRGGFNRVGAGRGWTAPFDADGSHTARTYTAYDIVEGNVVIQDGVSPSNGINSSRFAEIVAHEFGHTLGFGHSSDNTALMYSTVTGRGPGLRSDDELAARWLYPSSSGGGGGGGGGGQTPSKPNAPSNLAGTLLNDTTARLTWRDNSTVETSHTVYVKTGSAYAKLAVLGADAEALDVGGLAAGTTYRFRVTASNSAGESSFSNEAAVSTADDSVVAAFDVSATKGIAGETTFRFYDRSSGSVTGWSWSFGDGSTSTSRNPSRVYQLPGTYQVTLTVTGGSGQKSTASRKLEVGSPALPSVVAAFDVSAMSARENETVRFFDRSSGSPTWWQWKFGDGSSSTARNPSHSFTKEGTYTITLEAGNGSSSSTTSKQISIRKGEYRVENLIPVSTAVAGVGGTNWRTDLTMYNASEFGVDVTIVYLPGAGEKTRSRSLYLGSGSSRSWDNVLSELFGLGTGAGALRFDAVSPHGTPDLRISSRTYTDSPAGTYGQFVGDLPSESIPRTLYLTGIAQDERFRTNVGLVNRHSSTVETTLVLRARGGSVLGSTRVVLAPNSFQQQSLGALFPGVANRNRDQMSISLSSSARDAVSAYASIIDNTSQDPIFVQARGLLNEKELFVPAAGRTSGASGTYWRTDLHLFNPGPGSISIAVRYLQAGRDNRSASRRTVTLGANRTETISDVLAWLGYESGTGALEIAWSGNAEGVIATSRTYTSRGADEGTLGQAIAVAAASEFGPRAVVTGLTSNLDFRTNVGLVNSGLSTAGVTLRLVRPDGRELASTFVSVPARSQVQSSAAALFGESRVSNLGDFTVVAESPSPTVFAYGSVIDEESGDPIFVSGN